jgi:solute carrier family 13 (sodium-dependent dicarboxylate transporter), member 2/3/5
MLLKSSGFKLIVALLLGIVVLFLPRPEGTLFEISGDPSRTLLDSVWRQFEPFGGPVSSSSAYILKVKHPDAGQSSIAYLKEKAKIAQLPNIEIKHVDGLSPKTHRFLAILAFLIPLFIFEPIPLQITMIFIGVLLVGMNIADAKLAWAPYMHPVVVFIMCCLIFSVAADKSGLTKRLGYFIIRLSGQNMVRFTFILSISLGIVSTFIHDAAACAIGIVTIQPLIRAARIQPHSNAARFMMLSIPFATSCGGMGSLIGGGRCLVSAAFLKDFTGIEISFLDWIRFLGPAALVTIPITVLVVYLVFRPETKIILPQFNETTGPWTPIEKRALTISLVTFLLWVTKSMHGIDYSITGMLGVSALILFDVLAWEDIHTNLEWGTALFIFGGGISLGLAMGYSGAADYLAGSIHPLIKGNGWFILFVCVSVTTALATNVMANVAAVSLILPVALSLAHLENVDSRIVTLCIGAASSFAMLTVMGCPSNAIAFSYRYFKPSDLTQAGWVVTPVLLGAILLVAALWWNFLGLL